MWRGSFTLNFIGKSIPRSFISFHFFIYWSTIALQCCVNFCWSIYMKCFSYMYTYIPCLLGLPPTPSPTHLGYHRVPSWAPYAIQQVKVESFCTAQNHKQDKRITLRMWDHYLQVKQQSINLQNIQIAHAAQCQRNKQPNQKMGRRPK